MTFTFENKNTGDRFTTNEPYNHLINPHLSLKEYKFDHVGDLEEFCFKSYVENTSFELTTTLFEDYEKVGPMVMNIIENDPMITNKEQCMTQWFGSCYEVFREENIYI